MATVPTAEIQSNHDTEYLFDNSGERAEARFRDLSALYDARTIYYLNQRGIEEGWSCLEVGGGGGSITSWLCARVGVAGRVLATDIEPRFLQVLPFANLEVWRHDIRKDLLPTSEFDLVHARLVLIHLPEQETALRRMVAALKPGGWIVIEEFGDLSVLPDPTVNPVEVSLRVIHAYQEVLKSAGVDMRYGRLLPQKLQSNGLVNIGAEASVSIWKARSAGARLLKLSCQELRKPMIGSGLISQTEFDADIRRVDEEDFLMLSPTLWTAWGQVP